MATAQGDAEGTLRTATAREPAEGHSWIWSGRIPSLDGLRAIAITMVICSHIVHNGFRGAWSLGHFGVTLFFVISGFLITLLLIREKASKGCVSLTRFYQRRAFRILPAYAVLMLAVAALEIAGWYSVPARSWIRALTYTSCFSALTMAPALGHTWSLSVEEHFYLLWPLLFRLGKPRSLVAFLIGYIALSPGLRLLIMHNRFDWLDGTYSSPTQMAGIAVGCALAFLVAKGRIKKSRLAFGCGFGLFYAAILAGLNPAIGLALGDTLKACGAGALVVAILLLAPSHFVSRILNSAPFVWIGILSYSLYLWQQMLTDERIASWWGIPALLATAWLSYRFVELPFLRLKESFRSAPDGRRPAA